MSVRLPLVLGDDASEQQLQRTDWIDPHKTRLVADDDFKELRCKFRLLLFVLIEQGIDLPEELVAEIEAIGNLNMLNAGKDVR